MADFQELYGILQKREKKMKTYKQFKNELQDNTFQEDTRVLNQASDEMLIDDLQLNESAVVSAALFLRYRNKIKSLDMDNAHDLKKAFLLLADMAVISNIASTRSLKGLLKKR